MFGYILLAAKHKKSESKFKYVEDFCFKNCVTLITRF